MIHITACVDKIGVNRNSGCISQLFLNDQKHLLKYYEIKKFIFKNISFIFFLKLNNKFK